MTTSALPQNRNRWLAAVGYGLLAEISTIVTIVLIVTVYKYGIARGLSDAAYAAFSDKTGGAVGVVGGTLFTYLYSRILMRRLTTNFVAHGIVVALVAIVLSVMGSIAGHGTVPAAYILASILKLIAGWFAGFQTRKPAHLT